VSGIKIVLRISGVIFFIGLGMLGLLVYRSIIGTSGEPTLKTITEKVARNPWNPDGWYILGSVYAYNLSSSSINKADECFTKAVNLNPWYWKYWSELTYVLENSGEIDKAHHTIAVAMELNKSYTDLYWYAANFYLRDGRYTQAALCFRRTLEGNPSRINAVLELCLKTFPNPMDIIDHVLPDSISSLVTALRWGVNKQDLLLTRRTWQRILENREKFSIQSIFNYIHFLINNHQYQAAHQAWEYGLKRCLSPRPSSEDSLVFNSSFEYPPLQGGFGWRVRKNRHTRVRLDRIQRFNDFHSLRFDFDGTENVSKPILRQVVFLPHTGTYEFSYTILPQISTSDQGFYFEIRLFDAFPSSSVLARGPKNLDELNWRKQDVAFSISNDNSLIEILLKRDRSYKIENKLTGKLWIDAVTLSLEKHP